MCRSTAMPRRRDEGWELKIKGGKIHSQTPTQNSSSKHRLDPPRPRGAVRVAAGSADEKNIFRSTFGLISPPPKWADAQKPQ